MYSVSNFEDFDKKFDFEGLKRDLAYVERVGSDCKVPHGVYSVKITKLELTKSKASGEPMLICQFNILSGDFKGRALLMSQVLNNGIVLHKCNEFLRSISRLPVTFNSFVQYGKLLEDIMDEVAGKKEFQINYYKDYKGYDAFQIENVFILAD